MRTALYARISTNDGRQHLANQLDELRQFVAFDAEFPNDLSKGPAVEYTDEQSGATDDRPGLEALMKDARRRKFDLVIVWDLSRLTRGGPAKAFEYISQLRKCGVDFWSLKEPHFRTSGPAGDVFIALAAHIAREERRTMQARIVAGIERARKAGKIIGRPTSQVDPGRLLRYIEEGLSIRQIAKLENAAPATIHRRLAKLRQPAP